MNLTISKADSDTLTDILGRCGLDTNGPGFGPAAIKALGVLADTAQAGDLQIVFPVVSGEPAAPTKWVGTPFSAIVDSVAADADGAPHCYGPGGLGLDYLANAGRPGNWFGIATDLNGEPYIQGPNDPAPGYYVSTTSFQDPAYPISDPRRYVDSAIYPGCVLPESLVVKHGVKHGDLVLVERFANRSKCWAFFYDVGPALGEISVFAVQQLGGNPDPKHGGINDKCKFTVYPGSGVGKFLTLDEATARAALLGLTS